MKTSTKSTGSKSKTARKPAVKKGPTKRELTAKRDAEAMGNWLDRITGLTQVTLTPRGVTRKAK